ncbi:MAG: hypothetical protein HOY79_41785 [Streptomyces sp.]|nr:hypothetical protein [Streptomyces sp.]
MTTPPEPGRTTTTEAGPADPELPLLAPIPPHTDATYDGDGHTPDATVTHHRNDRLSFTVTLDAT